MDIYNCCENGNLEELQKLISEGANTNINNKNGWSPLHLACYTGNLEIVKELIKNHAHVNEKSNDGYTPLQFASYYGYLEIVKELIKYSDPTIKNNYEKTALDLAKIDEIKQLLIDNQYPITKRARRGI